VTPEAIAKLGKKGQTKMKCNCGHRLMCKDTREKDDIRYRRYVCDFCGEQSFTEEKYANPIRVKIMLSTIINELKLPAVETDRTQEELKAIISDRF